MSQVSAIGVLLRLQAAALALSLSACSVLPKSPPVTIYQLPAAVTAQSHPAAALPTITSLSIATPESSRILDSERIVIVRPDGRLAAWEGVRWSDPAPRLLRERLVETFWRDGRSVGVGTDSETFAAQLELRSTLRAFQLEYHADLPVVAVRFDARLLDRVSLTVIASKRFEIVQAAPGNQAEMVTAFGAATDSLTGQVVEWAAQESGSRRPLTPSGQAQR